jgi:hypothetical protein
MPEELRGALIDFIDKLAYGFKPSMMKEASQESSTKGRFVHCCFPAKIKFFFTVT